MKTCLWLSFVMILTACAAAITTSQACKDLAARHVRSPQWRRWVSFLGVPRPLAVWSTPDSAQSALAHLLALIIRHLLGYEEVVIREVNSTQNALEQLVNISSEEVPEEFVIVPGLQVSSSGREQSIATTIENNKEALIRAYKRPRLRLQTNLTESALADPRCNISTTDWLYFSTFSPEDCGFLSYDEVKNDISDGWVKLPKWCIEINACAALMVPDENSAYTIALEYLQKFVFTHRLKLVPIPQPKHQNLYNNRSLLFLSTPDSSYHSDSTYLFVHKHLSIYARRIALIMNPFITLATNTDIGSKLSKTSQDSNHIKEETCKYLNENEEQIKSWLPSENSTKFIQYCLCKDDPYKRKIKEAMNIVEQIIQRKVSFTLRLLRVELICDSGPESALLKELENFTRNLSWPLLGAVIAPRADAITQRLADDQETLLMLYESQKNPSQSFPVFLSAADWDSITTAAVEWLDKKGYKKVTLKIDNRSDEEIEEIQRKLSEHDINAQRYSKNTTAEVLIVDTDPDTVEELACDIVENTWDTRLMLLREWSSRPFTCRIQNVKLPPISMWTVSGSWPGGDLGTKRLIGADIELRQRLQRTLGDNWPPQVVPMTNAILTAAHALDYLQRQYPQFKHDIHGINVTSRFLSNIVRNLTIKGITQSLQFNTEHTLSEPVVFITHWQNGLSQLDTVMRISSNGSDIMWSMKESNYNRVTFLAVTLYSIFAVTAMAFICVLILKYWRVKHRKLTTSSQWPVPAQPAALELRRDEFEIHEKLGEGITGRVFLALWRRTHKLHVAVKTPVLGSGGAPALLWEARMMAPLRHPNVVRLLGIVAEGTPPFIVLEYAVRGDLRRYLAETERAAGGLKNVSPVFLTRLAREAAAALAYLHSCGVVHRDIRAANCLIDEHHTLKLADFGMARELPKGAPEGIGTNQYLCRRRALFPVPWMAPESLKRGVFSPASDMWSYGVLLVELVTLGARPYGAWAPHVVLCHIVNGGTPLLPLNPSNDMCEFTQQCWTRAANSRVTAAQALAFLERRPSALTPCAPVAPLSLPPTPSPPAASSLEEKTDNDDFSFNRNVLTNNACSV